MKSVEYTNSEIAGRLGVIEGVIRYRIKRVLSGKEDGRRPTLKTLYEWLRRDQGYQGSYDAFQRYIRKHCPQFRKKGAWIRVETPLGAISFGDWKEDLQMHMGRPGYWVKVQGLCFALEFSRKMADLTGLRRFPIMPVPTKAWGEWQPGFRAGPPEQEYLPSPFASRSSRRAFSGPWRRDRRDKTVRGTTSAQSRTAWVEYEFKAPTVISSSGAYRLDDRRFCRLPASWRILYEEGDQWKPAVPHGACGVEKDKFDSLRFDPVKARALRLEVEPQKILYKAGQGGSPDAMRIKEDIE